MSTQDKTSLAIKLLVPVFLGGLMLIAVINFIISESANDLYTDYMAGHTQEYIDSYLIATESVDNATDLARLTKAISDYASIEALYVVDNATQTILSAQDTAWIGKRSSDLPYDQQLTASLGTNKQTHKVAGNQQHLYSAPATLKLEGKAEQAVTVLLMTTPRSVDVVFERFKEDVLKSLIVIFIVGIAVFYGLLRITLLSPIKHIIEVLHLGKEEAEPVLCTINNNDELGILATTYNELIADRHEQRQELIAKNHQLEALSQQDALTGVTNRRYFDQILKSEWQRAVRQRNTLSLIMLDIDYFKSFNDKHGHVMGDVCLKKVATTLAKNLKRSGDVISRFGGEEFAVILPDSNANAWQLAESCRQAVEQLVIFEDSNKQPVSVTVSLGVATVIAEQSQSNTYLVQAADKALYEAKASGRNRVIVNDKAISKLRQEGYQDEKIVQRIVG